MYAAVFEKVKFQRFSTIMSSSSVPAPSAAFVFRIHTSHALMYLVVSCRSQMLCLCIYFFPFYSIEEVNSIDPSSSLLILLSVSANLIISLSSKLFHVGCACPFLVVGVIPAGVLGGRAGPWN